VTGGLRLLLLVVGATAAILLFVVFRAGDDDEPTATQPPPSAVSTIRPPPPKPFLVAISTDALKRATIPRGREVVLVISGLATGEEVHLHGYDVKRRSGPSGVVRLEFRATIPGRFEVELEASHRQIADLTVR
jgi:hypothetical protein